MKEKIFVIPANGLRVPMFDALGNAMPNKRIAAAGQFVPDLSVYRRMIACGDLILQEAKTEAKPKTTAKAAAMPQWPENEEV